MALFLVTGPPRAGKSYLIRTLTMRSDAEYLADITDGPARLIERAKRQDVWASTTSEETAAVLRPHAAREYTVRNLGAERCADLERQIAELQAKLAAASALNFDDTPRPNPGARPWETAAAEPATDPRAGSQRAIVLAAFRDRRLAGNLEGYTQSEAAERFANGGKSAQSVVVTLYWCGHLERRNDPTTGKYLYRAR